MKPHYDLTVIGGGIHGAGIAQAGAAAGYQVLLLEKGDWGAGTSCKSSKLIHGGLRYLQSGQFALVRESIIERERLLKLAPQLVHRNSFYIPVYEDSHYRGWQLRLGLSLYALLGLNRKPCRYQVLSSQQRRALPWLKKTGLREVFQYQDAQTDDRLLTCAVVQSAQSLGAETLTGATFLSAKRHEDGYRLRYCTNSGETEIISRVVINAGGPWVNRINAGVSPRPPCANVDLVQGTHLVLAGSLCEACFYLEAPQDQRAIFVMPWQGNTLLGTTETRFQGDPNTVAPLDSEITYLLEVLAHYFPSFKAQVLETFAGLRVLPTDTLTRTFHRSRETWLVSDQPGMPRWISVYGGKLTGYRASAEKIIKAASARLGYRPPRADTKTLPLSPPPAAGTRPAAPANGQNAG